MKNIEPETINDYDNIQPPKIKRIKPMWDKIKSAAVNRLLPYIRNNMNVRAEIKGKKVRITVTFRREVLYSGEISL